MIKENVTELLRELSVGNNMGEKITLVGATKFVPAENINEGIEGGLTDVGENKAQEFRDKYPLLLPVRYHFFGRLQKNKIKYLIGKAFLIQSVDDNSLIDEIDRQSVAAGVITNILLEVNLGEEQKGGYPLAEIGNALKYASLKKGVAVKGLMAMLPEGISEEEGGKLLDELRKTYDFYKEKYGFSYLSAGMSGDYRLAIKHGSNMVRIGTKIFGKRNLNV